ncbi:MAG: 23S rRNA (uracil(1939)-C(5))-methyltransferase RlmD [Dongiaceae bacterium]
MQTSRPESQGAPRIVELAIESIGARGDGIGRLAGQLVYVPRTVPGDQVRVRLGQRRGNGFAAEAIELLRPGADRVTPPCRHFDSCGGCALQHWSEERYAAWKSRQVAVALAHRGFQDAPVLPMLRVPAASRRRASLAAERAGKRVRLGFHQRASHRVVDLTDCHILLPELTRLLPSLRDLLAAMLTEGERAQIAITQTDSGVDLVLGRPGNLDLAAREALADYAVRADLARLSWLTPPDQAEPVAHRRPVRMRFGDVLVDLPPGAFLQPSAAGEAALVAGAAAALGNCRRIADLYAGCGTFSFPLAHGAQVHAVDGDRQAILALASAARRAGLGARVTSAARDLADSPLSAEELQPFDGVLFDPPRAGARAQARELARSSVPVAVAVSCDPATFARDARILVDGGYRLLEVAPVDQFVWSPHVELTAVFRR